MPEISKIVLPGSNTPYDIKDATARQLIEEMSGYTDFLGVTTTPLTDGATTNPITVAGSSVTAKKGNVVTYGSAEFIFNGTAWQEFGDLSGLGDLAYKDSASGSYTPAGSVSQPAFTGSSSTFTGNFTPAGGVSTTYNGTSTGANGNFTPAGTVSTPTITVTPSTVSKYVAASATGGGSVTAGSAASCTLPTFSATVSNETLTLGWSAGSFTANTPTAVTLPTFSSQTIATGISSASSSQPTFTGDKIYAHHSFSGTQGNVSVSGTPNGSVSQPTFTGTQATITVE